MNEIEMVNIIHFLISCFFFLIFNCTLGMIYYHCVYKFKNIKLQCPPPTPMPVNNNNSPHPDSPYNGLNGINVNTLPSENIINNNII